MPFYPNPVREGTDAVGSLGDGYTINIKWFQALPTTKTNKIAYHIYYSVEKDDVFEEGIKFVSIDAALQANIIDLIPGQDYFLAVRPVEYDPTIFNLSLLPVAHDNLRIYPHSLLRQDIGPTDLTIPLLDVTGFPSIGIIRIGEELIQYLAVDQVNNNLILSGGTAPSAPRFVIQPGGKTYLPSPTNTGVGQLNNLLVVSSTAPTETWTIRCIFVQQDGYGHSLPNTAKFEATGSISGRQRDGYGNEIIWTANGPNMSGSILSFSVSEMSPFLLGDSFIAQVLGATPGTNGGRGYNGTLITKHTTSGFDGYQTWNPIVTIYTIGEGKLFDRIFACQSRFEYPHHPWTMIDGYHQVLKDLLSTDLSAADAANVTFPMFDFAGFHRTDPVQLLNGTCVGSFIGGEMGCIDGYGNFNILRGFSLQDQNTQRQDILLSVTGRPAVLIRRVQTGITCACYLPSSEYQDDRCPLCFAPGTLVRTSVGYKTIEQIKIGDSVLSSDGKYHAVLRTFERMYKGDMQSIRSSVSANPILATPEHPFLTLRGSHGKENRCGPNSKCKAFIARGDGFRQSTPRQLPSGKWWARVQLKNEKRISLGSYITQEGAEQAIYQYTRDRTTPGHMLDWDDAMNIKKNDWLVAKYPIDIHDIDTIEVPQEFRKNTNLGEMRLGTNRFTIDEEFLWVVGMYLAEGSCSKRSIQFSLHAKETHFRDRLVAFFAAHGYRPKYHMVPENGMVVSVHSTTLAHWFPAWLGKKCYNKHIPEELMYLPDNKSWAIIKGVHDGDGSKRDHEIGQTSEILVLQLSELLHRVGEQPLIRSSMHSTLTPKGNKRRRCYHVNWAEDTLKNNNRKGRWIFGEDKLAQVKNSSVVPYSGPVYNLEVEGDHTYIVQGIVVHNCYGTKFVFGYEQYFNPRRSDGRILVRPGPTAENLRMQEAGLESDFPLDFWTLTVPTIKTRDVLVLFDQDDNEEFRYEVGDVIRNNTILGLDGGQHLKTFRVRKFDPIYQIRIFRNTADFPRVLNTSIGFVVGIPPHTHTITISEKIMSVSQINQTTGVSQGHNHPVISGQIMEVLGHSHIILL